MHIFDATADEELLPRSTPPMPAPKTNSVKEAFEILDNPLKGHSSSAGPLRQTNSQSHQPKAKSSALKSSPSRSTEKYKPPKVFPAKDDQAKKEIDQRKTMKTDKENIPNKRISPQFAETVKVRALEKGKLYKSLL
jgi:hypothetical protein